MWAAAEGRRVALGEATSLSQGKYYERLTVEGVSVGGGMKLFSTERESRQ